MSADEQKTNARPTPASRLGIVGPPAWPTALEDVVGYALWPKDYAERLRKHGIGDVISTAFTRDTALLARADKGTAKDASRSTVGTGALGGACNSSTTTTSDWPKAAVEQSLTLNDAQRGSLDELANAIEKAATEVRATCRDGLAATDRMRVLQSSLWAVHDGIQAIRAPLAKFYDQLSDEQKRQFTASSQSDSRNDMVRMCGTGARELPVQHVEQSLRASPPQRASLDALRKKSFEMGQFLMASCLKPMPATPAERLDAAADRLTAVIFAASNVNMALSDFTRQLDPGQKAKLETLER